MATEDQTGHKNNNSFSNSSTEMKCNGESHRGGRVWVDGCFDLLHCGHALALCSARNMGRSLYVGLQSDATIIEAKGPPVYKEQERYELVRGLKWVDEVFEDVPYGTTLELLNENKCDICVHGDDSVIAANSNDVLRDIMKVNRMRFFHRENVPSTSEIIDRILWLHKNTDLIDRQFEKRNVQVASACTQLKSLLKTREPQEHEKIVYAPGTFDLFHLGHQRFLQKAAALGDYLIVGVYDNDLATWSKGSIHPVLTLTERALRVLSCKYVADVVFGAPYYVDQEFISKYKINVVCHGETPVNTDKSGNDPFEVPKSKGIFRQISSNCHLRTSDVIERIISRSDEYEQRNKRKQTNNHNGDQYVLNNGNNLVNETEHVAPLKVEHNL